MNPLVMGALVLACTFGGVLAGMWLRRALPEHHFDAEFRATVTVAVGLVATMTALVLGLVTASAKAGFDALDAGVKQSAIDAISLDRVLARYGPEARDIREALHHTLGRRLDLTWPQSL